MVEKHMGLVLMEGRKAMHGLSPPLLASLVHQTTLISAMDTW